MNTILEAVLNYAKSGIPVFAIKPRAKTPLTEHGFKDATTDERLIRSQFTAQPNANVGIPTGVFLLK